MGLSCFGNPGFSGFRAVGVSRRRLPRRAAPPAGGSPGERLPRRRVSTAAGFHGGGFPRRRRCLPLRGKVRAAPGVNVLGLPFSRRRAPSCRKRVFRAEKGSASTASDTHGAHPARRKDAAAPCVRCLARRARGAAGVRVRRCLPCGQKRCRAARRIMAYHEKEHAPERFPHQKTFPTRRGTGKRASPRKGRSFPARRQFHVLPMSLSPQETDICAISQTKRAPFPCKTFHIYPSAANAAFYKARLPATAFRGEHPARAQAQLSIPCKIPAFHPSHRRLIPQPSRRENGGLCPRPLKGPDP